MSNAETKSSDCLIISCNVIVIIAKVSWHNPGFHTPRMDKLSREVMLTLMLMLMLMLVVILILMLMLML